MTRAVLAIVVLASFGCSSPEPAPPPEDAHLKKALEAAVAESTKRPVVARMTIDDLRSAYSENEFAARSKYGTEPNDECRRNLFNENVCRTVEVMADVDTMGRDQYDVPYLYLKTGVSARFTEKKRTKALESVRRGDHVIVRCSPDYDRGELVLNACELVPPS